MMLFGLIGFPLGHSRSEAYYREQFRNDGIFIADYRNFPIRSISELPGLIADNPSLAGFNVTIPYKEQILPYLSGLSPEASACGAVNLVMVHRQPGTTELWGHNTDVAGFRDSLPEPFRPSRALILGTGGAAKAVACVLRQKGIPFLFVSRHPSGPEMISYEALQSGTVSLADFPFVVNTTPLGMEPDRSSAPGIPYGRIAAGSLYYDLVYNPSETEFLLRAKAQGALTLSGEAMFLGQARASYLLFKDRIRTFTV
jgi:shikimate dehydrogenase